MCDEPVQRAAPAVAAADGVDTGGSGGTRRLVGTDHSPAGDRRARQPAAGHRAAARRRAEPRAGRARPDARRRRRPGVAGPARARSPSRRRGPAGVGVRAQAGRGRRRPRARGRRAPGPGRGAAADPGSVPAAGPLAAGARRRDGPLGEHLPGLARRVRRTAGPRPVACPRSPTSTGGSRPGGWWCSAGRARASRCWPRGSSSTCCGRATGATPCRSSSASGPGTRPPPGSGTGWPGQLVRDHPGLAATGHDESNLATALVEAGRILPVLDGFDELAAGLHRAALDALNATTLPLLLTSRPGEYATVAGTDALTAAAAVRLTDLTVTDLVDYLPRTTRKTRRRDRVGPGPGRAARPPRAPGQRQPPRGADHPADGGARPRHLQRPRRPRPVGAAGHRPVRQPVRARGPPARQLHPHGLPATGTRAGTPSACGAGSATSPSTSTGSAPRISPGGSWAARCAAARACWSSGWCPGWPSGCSAGC